MKSSGTRSPPPTGGPSPFACWRSAPQGRSATRRGVALWLEDQAGLLDGSRLRTIAARVWVVDRMHAGAAFPDTARALVRDLGFPPMEAVILCERSWRGRWCVARDAGYLRGLLRVRAAIDQGQTDIDELRTGRIGVADIPWLEKLSALGCSIVLQCPVRA